MEADNRSVAAHQDIGRHQWDIRAIAFSPVVLKVSLNVVHTDLTF